MATDETWVPNLLAAMKTALNITTLTCIARGMPLPTSKPPTAEDDGTVSTMWMTGISISTVNMSAFCTLIQEEVGSVRGDKTHGGGTKCKVSTQVTNTNYFGNLFGMFKDHKVKVNVVLCPVVGKSIEENELPQLPK
jgi:hypothetical protein